MAYRIFLDGVYQETITRFASRKDARRYAEAKYRVTGTRISIRKG